MCFALSVRCKPLTPTWGSSTPSRIPPASRWSASTGSGRSPSTTGSCGRCSSGGNSTAWRDGTCIAECSKGARHQAPADGCTCGVYSFRDLDHLRRQYSKSATLVGVIALEGRVVEGDSGWRAQAARLVALWEQAPGVVDVLLGVKRYRQVDDMVRAYSGLTVGSSSKSAAPRHALPRPVPSWTSLSGPDPRPVAASPTPPRFQRSARRALAGVCEFAIPLLCVGVPLVILVFGHGLVVVLIGIFVLLAVTVATVLVD